MRNGLLCILALQFFSRVSFFFTAISWLLAETKSWLLSGQSLCLEQKRQRIRLLLPFIDSSKWSHSPGSTSGFRNANRSPTVREMNVRACSLIRKTSCCHDAKEQEICEDDFFFIFVEVVVTLTSLTVDAVLMLMHATCMSWYGPAGPLAAFTGALRRWSSVQPDYDWSPFAMHGCTVSCRIFFDSHFFALHFAIVSQCPEFDSQSAMRKRINYSLGGLTQPRASISLHFWDNPLHSGHPTPDHSLHFWHYLSTTLYTTDTSFSATLYTTDSVCSPHLHPGSR